MIKLERLKKNIIDLGWIGFNDDKDEGLPIGGRGITRLPFTPEYEEAARFVGDLMKEAGLEVWRDSVGNLFGALSSKDTDKMVIIGSHIDTVPQGGLFDGSLGVLSALECLQTLKENNYDNKNNLVVAAFIGEEGGEIGGTFGSRCFTSDVELNQKEIDFLKKAGITPEDVKEAAINPEKLKCYLEMHIEQGQVLETEGIPIAIVEGIVGIARYKVTVKGKANHAGTTPMHLRDDALVKASREIIRLNKIINDLEGDLVGTVGELSLEPGAVNVIPGKVEFSIELRDMKKENIDKVINQFKVENRSDIEVEDLLYKGGVYLAKKIQKVIEKAVHKKDYDYKYMTSGAGHDANPLSRITPTGMIFVPSKEGISHSPDEWTDWKYVEKGAEVMFETIKLLDQN
ncbi:MAG: M20 family metallo-hydrolase [Halanaerobiales bacterium]